MPFSGAKNILMPVRIRNVEAVVEEQRERHPHDAPGGRLLEGHLVGVAVEDTEVEGQQEEDEGGEPAVEPPVLREGKQQDVGHGCGAACACDRRWFSRVPGLPRCSLRVYFLRIIMFTSYIPLDS
jgi:hypothetical protein